MRCSADIRAIETFTWGVHMSRLNERRLLEDYRSPFEVIAGDWVNHPDVRFMVLNVAAVYDVEEVFRFGLNPLVGVIDNYSNWDGLKTIIDTASLYGLGLEVRYLTNVTNITNIRFDVQPPRLSDTDEVTLSCNGFTLALTLTGRR